MPATQNVELAKGFDTTSAITKHRFCKLVSGSPQTVEMCDTAGERAYGVSEFSVSDAEILKGKGVTLNLEGLLILEAGEALDEGDLVATDDEGRAVVATSGDWILGTVSEAAGALGNECTVNFDTPVATLA